MPSSEKRSSQAPAFAPPVTTAATRPAAPTDRERELLALAQAELSEVATILRAAEERLCRTAAELHAFEPGASIAGVGAEPYSEVAIVAEDLGDCICILQSAREEIDPAGRPPARAIVADLVAGDRRGAEREFNRTALAALDAFDAGDTGKAIEGARELLQLLEANPFRSASSAPAASPDLYAFFNDTPQG